MDQERKNLYYLCISLVALLTLFLIIDFLMRVSMIRTEVTGIDALDQLIISTMLRGRESIFFIRCSLVVGLISMAWLKMGDHGSLNRFQQILFLSGTVTFIILFIQGYNSYLYYNIILYPLFSGLLFFTIPKAMGTFYNLAASEADKLKRVSKSRNEYTFHYRTTKGTLALHDARTATFIEGSAKAGKSASIIIPTIVQAVQKQFAGIIYDYEGDLTEQESALLSRTAYSAIKNSNTRVKFAIINFTDLSRTVQCNPLSSRYISSYNHAQELATVIMLNINRSWSRHKDFWGENAIAAYAATIWFFRRNLSSFCTIPHVTEFLLNDFRKVLRILQTDTDVAPYIRPIIAALERDASGQIAGAESSTQFPLSRMRSPEVYYVFNPTPEADFNMDITNPEHPVMLSVCNAPELQNALAPAIGAIIQVCKNQMNKLGKQKSIFLFDEMPTVYIDKADKIPAEARKKLVCTFFAVQTYDQLVRDYGIENAKVIRNSCGNLFTGITGVDSAEMISKMMGEERLPDFSTTTNPSGQSITHSLKEQRVLKTSKIAAQPTGHFSGRIMGGNPSYFSAQFRYRKYPAEEIPHFNYPVELDDPGLQKNILDALVLENYEQIKKDVNEIFGRYAYLFEDN